MGIQPPTNSQTDAVLNSVPGLRELGGKLENGIQIDRSVNPKTLQTMGMRVDANGNCLGVLTFSNHNGIRIDGQSFSADTAITLDQNTLGLRISEKAGFVQIVSENRHNPDNVLALNKPSSGTVPVDTTSPLSDLSAYPKGTRYAVMGKDDVR